MRNSDIPYTHSCAAIESLGYHTRDIVPFQSTFNSRDSNLYRAAVWIVPFREDYVNIYTASEIPADFPTAPTPYIPFPATDRGFYRNGKLLTSKGIDRVAHFRSRVFGILRKRERRCRILSLRDKSPISGNVEATKRYIGWTHIGNFET